MSIAAMSTMAPPGTVTQTVTGEKPLAAKVRWEMPYRVTRALSLEMSEHGDWLATTSLSRPVETLTSDTLMILQRFAGGAMPREVFESLSREWTVQRSEFGATVEALCRKGLLRIDDSGGSSSRSPVEPALSSPADAQRVPFSASASLPTHHALLTDVPRVMAYAQVIGRHCRDRVVVEVGCGSGILSIFAARAGARRVIAIEEMEIADLAAAMIEANGCADVVELRRGNSRDLDLDTQADVIVHEIFGVDPFEENLLPSIVDARRRFLKPGGRLLPDRVEVFCLGVEVPEPTGVQPRMIEQARQLQGLYGLDFGPYLDILQQVEANRLPGLQPGFVGGDSEQPFRPRVLTEPCRLLDLDLQSQDGGVADALAQMASARLAVRESGRLNGLSLYFEAHLDASTVLSTSPFAPLTTWGRHVRGLQQPLLVRPGQGVDLQCQLRNPRGKQQLQVDLVP